MAQYNLPEMPAGPVLELYGQRKRFTIPIGLKCLLEEISREVLREQPTDIYDFIATYLEKKLRGECKKYEKEDLGEYDEEEMPGEYEEDLDAAEAAENEKIWDWKPKTPAVTDDELLDFLEDHDLTVEEANRMATVIQATFRGFKARKQIPKKQDSGDPSDGEYDGEDMYVARDSAGRIVRFDGDEANRIMAQHRLSVDDARKYAKKIENTLGEYEKDRTRFSIDNPDLADKLQKVDDRVKKRNSRGSKDMDALDELARTDEEEDEEEEEEEEELDPAEAEESFGLDSFKQGVGDEEEEEEQPLDGFPAPIV